MGKTYRHEKEWDPQFESEEAYKEWERKLREEREREEYEDYLKHCPDPEEEPGRFYYVEVLGGSVYD